MKNPLREIQRIVLGINKNSSADSDSKSVRGLVAAVVRSGGKIAERIQDLNGLKDLKTQETRTWISSEVLEAGGGGPFDACDLRHWLTLAEKAGVPAVPARDILTMTEAEIEAVSEASLELPEGRAVVRMAALLASSSADLDKLLRPDGLKEDRELPPRESVIEKIASAMDDVPEGWMVRHARHGASTLKALSCCGVAGIEAPEVKFGPHVDVGPGWVRLGNRRMVDVMDSRFMQAIAQAPDGPSTFVARPWVKASRYIVADDPHRAGSPLAGAGGWPAEWRAFVENGLVTGISWYYPNTGSVTQENAKSALAVRDLAQRIVDQAKLQAAAPRLMDIEFARRNPNLADQMNARFPADGVSCTLDFIETDDGPVLLEGGPPFTPIGGGHPCAFAGVWQPEGVAFKTMDGVDLMQPGSWKSARLNPAGSILSWSDVEELAKDPPSPKAI